MKLEDLVQLLISCDDLKQDAKSLTGTVKDLAKAYQGHNYDGEYLFPTILKDFEFCQKNINIIKEILIENNLIDKGEN